MAANDYRAYLRNHIDMEEAPGRAPHTGSTHRALIFGTLAVMGLLQVASSVAILLHLTGYLREVDLASAQQSPNEEMHSETLIADPLKGLKDKKEKCRTKKDLRMPSAHLPIKTPIHFLPKDRNDLTVILWDDFGGLKKMKYHDGRLLVDETGYYYVYAKTCFRYAKEHESGEEDVSNVQLFQYICHEKHTQSVITPVHLTKSGGTLQWNISDYNMYCVEQGRGIQLSKGDGIFVSVSNAWLLDAAAEGTYFGAFKISD
ncbi:Tumor necrosis factor ligand superfamily member 11 [Labeo rohita]|uniref:Tumor necrosis factor ligand superfamily member 11 n=1 Tax=Labeo rohita TaxID=84645 RepID=A0ABQ8MC38_LABRO|nr:tumor necrosis factor ligand superfamily member 11 [Labeo rohita]KAI2660423.1 Tumor necrosis factor ligand superfamily member 11 [Labeo rohita]